MYLCGSTNALTELGIDNSPDFVEGTLLALESATHQLEADLRNGSFDRVTRTDTFYIDERFAITPAMKAQLKLTSGFVDSTQPYTIVAGSTWNDLTNTPPITPYVNWMANLGATLNIAAYSNIDYSKGVVDLIGMWLQMFPWIQVTYTCGFGAVTDQGQANQYDPAQVPDWLQKLCLMGARIILPDTIPQKESGSKPNPTGLIRAYNSGVAARCRYFPGATLPKTTQLSVAPTQAQE